MQACTHAALAPLHESDVHVSPSSGQAVPCEAPVQLAVVVAYAFAGQAPEVPVQVSATSHWPAEARQTVALVRKTSTHALLVPVQWSAASLSHGPPCEAPVQLAVLVA